MRAINIERDGERYGTYYQAVRSYREAGKVKQDVIHLGEHATANEALAVWTEEIRSLRTTRPRKAEKLQRKRERLRAIKSTD